MSNFSSFSQRAVRWANRSWRQAYEAHRLAGWARLEKRLPRTVDGQLLLHIGCGDVNATDFVNIDARPLPHVHIVAESLFNLYMIPDGVADLVYMSHVLEHVSHLSLNQTLGELRRILKRGGLLRLSVPDFDKLLAIYNQEGCDLRAIEQPLMGGQDYPQNYHYSVFNERYLRAALEGAGMRDVHLWNADQCDHHDFTDWANRKVEYAGRHFDVSLNIAARAP